MVANIGNNKGLFAAIGKTLTEGYERTKECPYPHEAATGRLAISPCATASVHEFKVGDKTMLSGSVAGHGWSPPHEGKLEDHAVDGWKIHHQHEYHVHNKDTGELMGKFGPHQKSDAGHLARFGHEGWKPGHADGTIPIPYHPVKIYDKVTGEHIATHEKRPGDKYPIARNVKTGEETYESL